MPIVILILTAVGGAIWFWVRSNPRQALDVAADAVTVARNAPRKLAFRRQTKAHPVEGIDDPNIAICALAQAFIELDNLPTAEQRSRLDKMLRKRCTPAEAEEIQVLGRWLVAQCGTPEAAIAKLSRRLYKIDGSASWAALQDILMALVGDVLSPRQADAVAEMKRAILR